MQAIPHHENEADLSHHKCFVAAMTILAAVASALHTIAVGRGIIWTDKVGTAATDGVFIYISPAFFMGLPNDFQRAFLIGHETLHIVLKHMFRGRLFRERGYFNHQLGWCHRTYNAAADYIINAMLIKMGLEMPECGLISDEFTADDVAEEVYVKLYQQPEDDEPEEGEQGDDSDEDGEGEDGEGESDDEGDSGEGAESDDSDDSDEDDSGSGQGDDEGDEPDQDGEGEGEGEGAGDESTGEPVPTDHDGHDEHLEPKYGGTSQEQKEQEREDSAEIQREIDEAVEQAEREGQDVGNLRGATSQGDHKVDPLDDNWEDLLESHLIAKAREGNDDWSRINRRKFSLLGIVAPSKKGSLKRLALIKDISWSVLDRSRALFDAKIAELLDQITPAEGTLVLHTTTEVEQAEDVYSGDEYLSSQKVCGGGTYMSAGLDWMEENGEYADLTICFTDSDVSRDDLAQLAEAGVLIVLDSYSSYVSAKERLEASGIEFIVVNDRPA
jgi:predicted metal-dependent peptidase